MALVFNGEETASFVYVERQTSSQGNSRPAPPSERNRFATRIRKWDIPHWDVPAAFENPRLALEELGEELYKECVREHYQAIANAGVEQAQIQHYRWAINKVVSSFETHIRGYAGGRFIAHGPDVCNPKELWESGVLMMDLEYIMNRYQVRGDLRSLAVETVKAKLQKQWGAYL